MDLGRQYETTGAAVTFAWEAALYDVESSEGPDCSSAAAARSFVTYDNFEQDWGGTEGRLYYPGKRIVQCFRLYIKQGFSDGLEKQLGTAVRMMELFWDSNWATKTEVTVADGGVDEFGAGVTSGLWYYPPRDVVDDDLNTYWLSRLNGKSATVWIDLGSEYNIAGLAIHLKYLCGTIKLSVSNTPGNEGPFSLIETITDNQQLSIYRNARELHFKGRTFQIELSNAYQLDWVLRPDEPLGSQKKQPLFGIRDVFMTEHTGGGGLFGVEVEQDDGCLVYDVLSYANLQPGTWAMASEGDYRTVDSEGSMENSTTTVHVVVTFAGNEIVMYRNGVKYGTTYTKGDATFWPANKTRVVFGLRGRVDDGGCGRPTKHGDTHSPYFSGRILAATLFNSALYDVEVEQKTFLCILKCFVSRHFCQLLFTQFMTIVSCLKSQF